METKPKTHRLMDYLRIYPNQTNKEIAEGLGPDFDSNNVRDYVSTLKARDWLKVTGTGANRHIDVVYEDPVTMQEFKKDIYTQMLPPLLHSFEQTTNAQDQVLVAKTIFKILENL